MFYLIWSRAAAIKNDDHYITYIIIIWYLISLWQLNTWKSISTRSLFSIFFHNSCECVSFFGIVFLESTVNWVVQLKAGITTYVIKTKCTVYPKKYAHGCVVLCFVVVMQSFIMNSHEVFIHIHQGCFAGTGAIVRLPQCQWSKPDGYGKISQCITTTKHSKAKTVCIFLGIYWIDKKPWITFYATHVNPSSSH